MRIYLVSFFFTSKNSPKPQRFGPMVKRVLAHSETEAQETLMAHPDNQDRVIEIDSVTVAPDGDDPKVLILD